MTNVLYNTQWPVNQKQQLELITRLETQIALLEARRIPIVIRSMIPPIQADWETAWVSTTGLTLPIPPGTKLMWYDTAKAIVWTYTVAFDLQAGEESSGTVVRMVDQTYDRPPLRLLAQFNSADYNGISINAIPGATVFSVFEHTSGIFGFNIPLNLYTLTRMGLRDIQIFYRLRLDSVTTTDKLFINFAADGSGNTWSIASNPQWGYVNFEETQAAQTRTDNGGASGNATMDIGGRSAYNSSIANGYATGLIQMTHIAPQPDVSQLGSEKLLFQGFHLGTRIDDALTTGKFGINWGSFYSYGNLPPKESFPALAGDNGFGVTDVRNGVAGKVWVYGLFTKNTQELLDGQFL